FAFLVTAVTAGQLSGPGKSRAEEGEGGGRGIERLYRELQLSFGKGSENQALCRRERFKTARFRAGTHYMRTTLTSIKAAVTPLLDEVKKRSQEDNLISLGVEGRREMLDVINEETDGLDRFIGGLMELARIEAGEVQLRKHGGPVEEIVAGAIARATPLTAK